MSHNSMTFLAMPAHKMKTKSARGASPCSVASCSTTASSRTDASGISCSSNSTSSSCRSSNTTASRSSLSLHKANKKRRQQLPTGHSTLDVKEDHLEAKAFNLGELIGAIKPLTPHNKAYDPLAGTDRFLDLLEAEVEGNEAYGQALAKLNFSATLVDPSHPDCAVVACSAGFTGLTGYHNNDVIGKSCCLLELHVPCTPLHTGACMARRALYAASACGTWLSTAVPRYLVDEPKGHLGNGRPLPDGELVYIQTNSKKNGELFQCMWYLKQVELDNHHLVLGVQAQIPDAAINPEETYQEAALADKAELHYQTFARLSRNMDVAEQVLASHFCYCAGMRRQISDPEVLDQDVLAM